MAIANRTLGAFWILVGSLIGLLSVLYMVTFGRVTDRISDALGAAAPLVNYLTDRLEPGYLNWWALALAVFLVLMGVRLLMLAPVARPVAMAFHLLSGLFVLVITIVLFMAVNGIGGVVGAIVAPVSSTALVVGLVVGLLFLFIGVWLASKPAWDAFMTGGVARIVREPADTDGGQPAAAARLVNLNDGAEYRLPRSAARVSIGSEAGRTIVIDDLTVSRNHAYIEFDNGEYRLTDSSSTNGTFVNGQQLIALGHTLQPNDEIRLGNVRLRFES